MLRPQKGNLVVSVNDISFKFQVLYPGLYCVRYTTVSIGHHVPGARILKQKYRNKVKYRKPGVRHFWVLQIPIFLLRNIISLFLILFLSSNSLKLKSTQMHRSLKGNSGVLFYSYILCWGLYCIQYILYSCIDWFICAHKPKIIQFLRRKERK